MNELESWLILNKVLFLHAGKANKLLAANDFDPQRILKNDSQKNADYIGDKLAYSLKRIDQKQVLKVTCAWIEKNRISLIKISDKYYPRLLKEIYDPPFLLFINGIIDFDSKPFIAIVGGRKNSEYGAGLAFKFAKELSCHDVNIVSGMARGIDSNAHHGALKGCAKTVAVLGCGLNIMYPKENVRLYNEIAKKGAVISEFPYDTPPLPHHFPYRNRVVSGLSKGVLVIEARKKSGSLITANLALEQNRDVWAIPARPKDKSFEGGNLLIQAGARVVLDPSDIAIDLGINYQSSIEEKDKNLELSSDEKMILSFLSDEPLLLDELYEKCEKLTSSKISYFLLSLEMKKIIKRLPGQYIVRAML